jgi:hypothetical protein
MSKLYATITSEGTARSTRTAHSRIEATAQSYHGSIGIELTINGEDVHVDIWYQMGESTAYPHTLLWSGPLSALPNVYATCIDPRD